MNISPVDRQKYSDIFQAQNPINGKLSGQQAKSVFMQSGLALPQLGQIWNLCDIDKDGQMDVDEFVLAMHFIFSTLSGSLQSLPTTLPPHLIPPSKNQFNASQPIAPIHSLPATRPPQLPPTNRGFDWHINSSDKANYESLFNRFCRPGSSTTDLSTLKGFLQEKGFSSNDLNQAWNLVDVRRTQSLNRDQFALLLHILDSRSKGTAFPDKIPIHLSNRFLGIAPPPATPISMPRPVVSTYTPPVSAPTLPPNSSNSTHSWAFEPPKPQVDQAAVQEAREKEKRLREEIAELDRKLATPPPDNSMSHKTKEELENLLSFLQKLEKALPKAAGQSGNNEGEVMLKDLEFLAKSIKDKHSELTSIVALQKRELEELQLAINKKKYGV